MSMYTVKYIILRDQRKQIFRRILTMSPLSVRVLSQWNQVYDNKKETAEVVDASGADASSGTSENGLSFVS